MFRKAELKQDEVAESANINEAEEISASPAEVRFSAEEEQSESISPSLGGVTGPQPSSVESYQTLDSKKGAPGTPIPLDWQSNSCIADEMDSVLDIKSIPVSELSFVIISSVLVYLVYVLLILEFLATLLTYICRPVLLISA